MALLTAEQARTLTADTFVSRRERLKADIEARIAAAIEEGQYHTEVHIPSDVATQVRNFLIGSPYLYTVTDVPNMPNVMRISWAA